MTATASPRVVWPIIPLECIRINGPVAGVEMTMANTVVDSANSGGRANAKNGMSFVFCPGCAAAASAASPVRPSFVLVSSAAGAAGSGGRGNEKNGILAGFGPPRFNVAPRTLLPCLRSPLGNAAASGGRANEKNGEMGCVGGTRNTPASSPALPAGPTLELDGAGGVAERLFPEV